MSVHLVLLWDSYFLAYSCELFVVGRVNVVDKKSVSVNLFVAILRGFFFLLF